MSRNLSETGCHFCPAPGRDIVLEEEPRPITRADAGRYFDEYEGFMMANAHCYHCDAKYLAWCAESKAWLRKYGRERYPNEPRDGLRHFDLSFRSTFNDEPGPDDLPKWACVSRIDRVGPFAESERGKWWVENYGPRPAAPPGPEDR